jgi:hypothetical protein
MMSHRSLASAAYNHLGRQRMTHMERDAEPVAKDELTLLSFGLSPMSYIFKAGHTGPAPNDADLHPCVRAHADRRFRLSMMISR